MNKKKKKKPWNFILTFFETQRFGRSFLLTVLKKIVSKDDLVLIFISLKLRTKSTVWNDIKHHK